MHVSRTGTWLSLKPDSTKPDDLSFVNDIGATYIDKLHVWRVRYNESVFEEVVQYVGLHAGTMDSTCLELASFEPTWGKTLPETVVPSKREQMKHQKQGVSFLLQFKRAMLGFDMGTGKTKTAVDTVAALTVHKLLANRSAKNVLVVTDASVVSTWVDTLIGEDQDAQAISLIGSRTERISRLRYGLANGVQYFVINYDGVPVIDDELAASFGADTVLVLDESQRVKNHTTKRFKTLWKLFERCQFEHVFLLSGTPITQSPEDVFGQYAFIDTKLFGHPKSGWWGFKATYIQTLPTDNHIVIGYRNMGRFLQKFHSRCFRVKTSDVIDLPPKQFLPIKLELPAQLAKVYQEYVRSKGFVYIPGHARAIDDDGQVYVATHPFTMLSKSLQIANNFLYLNSTDEDGKDTVDIVELFDGCPNPKLDYLLQMLDDTDQPLVVWFHHRAMKRIIEAGLLAARHSFVTVHGGVPLTQRGPLLEQFTKGRARVLVAQDDTIRTGVSLVRSRINVYMERWYKVETRQQSEKRTHRIGMRDDVENVLYVDLMYKHTAEVTVYDRLRKGIELSSALVDRDNVQLMLTGVWNVN